MYILPPSISKKIEGYRWQSFTPPAAGKSRRFRGLICHRRSHGRLIRDIERKIDGDEGLQETFAVALGRAAQIRGQKQRQRGWKLYSWHAPETECIGKGKARAPYEFGVKVSLTTTNRRCKGGHGSSSIRKPCPVTPTTATP